MKLTRDHIAPDGQCDLPVRAIMPFYMNFLIRFAMLWLPAAHPLRRSLRRILDMMQIYDLSMGLDAATLTARAEHYGLKDMIADCALWPGMSLRAQALYEASDLPEIDRVSPGCDAVPTSISAAATPRKAKAGLLLTGLTPQYVMDIQDRFHAHVLCRITSTSLFNKPFHGVLNIQVSGVPP